MKEATLTIAEHLQTFNPAKTPVHKHHPWTPNPATPTTKHPPRRIAKSSNKYLFFFIPF
ncbi:MAG: hypothetical protein WA958_03605 [Tunicatimonas sp.]